LGIEPIEELKSLRGTQLLSLSNKTLTEANQQLEAITGDMLEIQLEIEPTTAKQIGIKLRCTPDGAEETLLYVDTEQSQFAVDRRKTSLHPMEKCGGVQGGKLELLEDTLKLHI